MTKETYRKVDPSRRKSKLQVIENQMQLLEKVRRLEYIPEANFMKLEGEGFEPPTTDQLFSVLDEEGVTPEEFAEIIGRDPRSARTYIKIGDEISKIDPKLLQLFLIRIGKVPCVT